MIDDFCDSFTAEIRWTAVNNRMKVMCTEKKFIETITHYDRDFQERKIEDYWWNFQNNDKKHAHTDKKKKIW